MPPKNAHFGFVQWKSFQLKIGISMIGEETCKLGYRLGCYNKEVEKYSDIYNREIDLLHKSLGRWLRYGMVVWFGMFWYDLGLRVLGIVSLPFSTCGFHFTIQDVLGSIIMNTFRLEGMRKDISPPLKKTASNLNITIPAHFLLTRT